MAARNGLNREVVMGLVGAGEGILLGRGLEICFGINQYLLIMLFGVLGGVGIALMVWMGSRWVEGDKKARLGLVLSGAGSAGVVFAVYFLLRVLPLIKEEIRFSYS